MILKLLVQTLSSEEAGRYQKVSFVGNSTIAMEKEVEHENRELKHLGFVRSVAIHSVVFICNLYESAKQNLGPLRSPIGSIENAVSTLVGPFYEKFKDVPGNVLEFLDEKVDEAKDKFDRDAPSGVKQVVSHAETLIQQAAKKGQELIHEARSGGLPAALQYAAEESKHLVLDGSVKIWTKLNEYPILHSAAEIAVPTAAHWSEKYNHVLKYMTRKGYPLVGCLPLIPIDEIAKAFKQGDTGKAEDQTSGDPST